MSRHPCARFSIRVVPLAATLLASATAFAQRDPSELPAVFTVITHEGNVLAFRGHDGATQRADVGCPIRVTESYLDQIFVGCAGGEVVVIEGSSIEAPHIVRRVRFDGEITSFFVRGGIPHVVLRRETPLEAASVSIGDTSFDATTGGRSNLSAPMASPNADVGADEGDVIATSPGEAIVDLGSLDGIRIGTHMAFGHRAESPASANVPVVVGQVVEVFPNRCRVRLGFAEEVALHTDAERTAEPLTSSRVGAPRVGGYFEIGGSLLGFFALGQPAGGILGTARVAYHFTTPWMLEAGFAPAGGVSGIRSGPFGTVANSVAGTLMLRAIAAVDLRYFSFGLGVGLASHVPEFSALSSFGVAFVQTARFGPLDGLHLRVENAVGWFENHFSWSTITMMGRIPVVPHVWFDLAGGGGTAGYGFGSVGVRVMARGNGARGSLFVTPSIGFVTIFNRIESPTGPATGIEFELRI